MLVNIPFQPEWENKMLSGQKTCTSRTKRYGNTGDTFNIFGATFRITSVSRLFLTQVANELYKEEGCVSPNEFIHIWRNLHPRAGWRSFQEVYTHFFRKEA